MTTTAIDTNETRKAGDQLILSGAMPEATPLDDSAWAGAVGKINIALAADPLTLLVDHGTVNLTTNATPKRYLYSGPGLPVGKYLYEIEVTFSGMPEPLTWPNDGSKNKLKVISQVG